MRILLFFCGLWLPVLTFGSAAPAVVVSILPVHSLAAGVMQGGGDPTLLVEGGRSPHDFSLRPSAARALQRAALVVWIGPELESFLVHPLAQARSQVLGLLDAPGMRVLSGARAEAEAQDHHHAAGERDGHIWLDPRNAMVIVQRLVEVLGELDPERQTLYRNNGEQLQQRLRALDQALERRLTPLREVPFLVYHDAYRYLETRYGLDALAAVSLGPERTPGARRVRELRALIQDSGARCVFSEPQFQSRLLPVLTEDSSARAVVLDPLGASLEPGPEAYFLLLEQLASQLESCLDERPNR